MNNIKEDLRLYLWPGPGYLTIYAVTGALTGLASTPIELAWQHAPHQHALDPATRGCRLTPTTPPSPVNFLASHTPGVVARTAVRFLAFGQFKRIRDVKRAAGTNYWPRWLDFGASGGGAGLVEVVVANRLTRPLSGFPPLPLLARHPGKLFMCFGTFGFLSTSFSDQQPPRPFWKCWMLGAVAGGVGSGLAAALEGLRGRALWMNAVPRGAMVVGTVISVQVTSCAEVFKRYGG